MSFFFNTLLNNKPLNYKDYTFILSTKKKNKQKQQNLQNGTLKKKTQKIQK